VKIVAPLILIVMASATVATQTVFKARVEGVRVDVLVTDSSRRPLRGLTPADFVIRDNGVPQQADLVSYGEIALNVGLAFDLSDSVKGRRLEQLRVASNALTAELLPADQSALVSFSREVRLPCPLSLDRQCIARALQAATPNGETALVDGILAGLIVGESEVGRSLLMVFSDGLDTASATRAAHLLNMARHSDVVVYPVATKGARPDFLEDLASFTGGRLYEMESNDDLSKIFKAILDEFRFRYLVTYTPTNVSKTGWHTLDVKVNRPGARVKARPGYQGGER